MEDVSRESRGKLRTLVKDKLARDASKENVEGERTRMAGQRKKRKKIHQKEMLLPLKVRGKAKGYPQ